MQLTEYQQQKILTVNIVYIAMNRTLTPTKTDISPKKNSNSHQRSSASKSPAKREGLSDVDLQAKLKKNRQKLAHTLDTYTMLIRSKHPIRCLEHNSVISIFCETQNRLLCTNCVFGKNQHKFHKIQPIDKTIDKVKNNVEKMKLPIERQAQMLQNIKDVVLTNLDQQTIDLHKTIDTLILRHAEAHRMLQQNLFRAKNQLLDQMQLVKLRHQTVALQLNFLKELYNINAPTLLCDIDDLDETQLLLYQHSLLTTLSSQKKFQGNIWNVPRNDIRTQGQYQIRQITKICDQLSGYVSMAIF